MKKILLVIMLVLTLTLSGCDEEPNKGITNYFGVDEEYIEDNYYTQEEVDSLLRQQNIEIMQTLMEYYIQSYDGKLYTNCRIEDSIKVCDEVILNGE